MHAEVYIQGEIDEDQRIDFRKNRPVPQIHIDRQEVEDRTGMASGAEVCEIHISREDGPRSVAKFWIDARIDKRGNPIIVVATNVGNATETKKIKGEFR